MSATKYPSTGTQTDVVFKYTSNDLVQLLMETCQNMVKIATGQSGELLVNEYAMDEDTPSTKMKQKLLDTPVSDVVYDIHKVCSASWSSLFKPTLSGTGNSIEIPIKYVATYNPAHIDSIDRNIQDMLIYGALVQWFSAVNATEMKALCVAEYNRARASLIFGVKELYRKCVFKAISEFTVNEEEEVEDSEPQEEEEP